MRLSTRIIWTILLMILIPMLVFGILINISMTQYALDENYTALSSFAARIGSDVDEYLVRTAKAVHLISQDTLYAEVLAASNGAAKRDTAQAISLLDLQTGSLSDCRDAFLLSASGMVLASSSGTRIGEIYAEDTLLTELQKRESFFSGILRTDDGNPYFFQTNVVRQNDQTLGYLAVEFNSSYFTSLVKTPVAGQTGYIFFVDASDFVFAHRYPERQLPLSVYDRNNGLYHALNNIRSSQPTAVAEISYDYNNQISLHGACLPIPSIGGYVLAVRPTSDLRGTASDPLFMLNLMLIIVGLLCILTAAFIILSVRRPAFRILHSIDSLLKEGGYIHCNYDADNELGWIAESINRLNTEITNIMDELKESEKRYRIALEAVSDIVWEYDVATEKYTFMAKDKSMLGARRVENISIINCPWAYASDPEIEERRDAEFKRFVAGAVRTYRTEYETRDIRGNVTWAESIATALKNKDDKIVKVIGSISDITQKKLYDIRVLHSAEYDKLTSIYNRATIEKRIKEALPNTKQSALMMIDLDNFKVINDTFGHQFGDQILKFVSSSIVNTVKPHGLVGRIGGDEFVVFIKQFDSDEALEQIANKIVAALQNGYEKEGITHRLSGSVGVAKTGEFGADTYKKLLANADFAMYGAKRKGKNKYNLFTESLHREKVKNDVVAEHLRDIAHNDILTVSFEPVFCSRNDRIVRFVADTDITIPEYSDLSREEVLKIALESNQQSTLLETTFRKVCQAITSVEKYNNYHTCITFPIPVLSLSKEAILSALVRVSQEEGVNPKTLGFSLNPHTVRSLDHSVYTFIAGLRRISSDIELTEFGGLHTSYNVVSDFNFDTVRFAEDTIVKAMHSRKHLSILGSIMDIARQSATACTLSLSIKQHEFFKARLSGCYYYCTGEKMSAEAFYKEIKSKELTMNKYDCPDYKSRLLENTIMGL